MLSFSNSYIFKKDELIKFDISKRVNFHPGLPKYPGRDTSHFACFNNEKIFGGTIHSIEKKIDSGKIIEMKKFKVILKKPNHYIYTKLGHKAICYLLEKNFNSILNSKIKFKNIKWSKKLYTRKKFLRNLFVKNKINLKNLDHLKRSFYTPNYKSLYYKKNRRKIYFKFS